MKHSSDTTRPTGEVTKRKRHPGWRRLGIFLIVLVTVLAIGRLFLPMFVRDYVNRTLDKNPMYDGTIGDVRIHLWRGAYSIEEVKINKTAGSVPVPFFAGKRVDFAIEWKALWNRRIVGRVHMLEPELNFVDAPDEGDSQSGTGAPWLEMIKDLFPFKINSAVIENGSIHFRAYQMARPVDVYISKVEGKIDNLGNIRDETTPLVSTVEAKGLVMDHAKFEYKMTLDPFAYRPTFHMALQLLGLDVTRINDLALAYGKFDFKRGYFDLVLETDVQEGLISGYAKPLFRNLKVFSITEDIEEGNVLHFFWQALVGGVTFVFKNHQRDQFGTLIPFSGDATGATSADIFATLGNILRNAFIRAYLPRLEGGQQAVGNLNFEPPEFTDPISAGDGEQP